MAAIRAPPCCMFLNMVRLRLWGLGLVASRLSSDSEIRVSALTLVHKPGEVLDPGGRVPDFGVDGIRL